MSSELTVKQTTMHLLSGIWKESEKRLNRPEGLVPCLRMKLLILILILYLGLRHGPENTLSAFLYIEMCL